MVNTKNLPLMLSLIGLLASACTASRTEVLIVTDTDFRVPRDMDQIEIEVMSPDGVMQRSTATLGRSEAPLPRVLGLVYESNAPLGPYSVTVTGRESGSMVVTREADFTFIRGRTLMLRMDLLRSCEDTSCAADETCGESGCRSRTIAPAELQEWTGEVVALGLIDAGDAGSPADGGVADAGVITMDAGPGMSDAGPGMLDAGFDAGPPPSVDAGCIPVTESCNDADDDCDGMVDEDFDFDNDDMNCGRCGEVCRSRDMCCTGNCQRSC